MSKKSATDFTKKHNPQNISGSIKKALELIQSLRESKGNPPMVQAVGAGNLSSMLAQVAAAFSGQEAKEDKRKRIEELKAEIARLKKVLAEMLAMEPKTPELVEAIEELKATIALLEEELALLEAEIV